jgi:hypothetical protein
MSKSLLLSLMLASRAAITVAESEFERGPRELFDLTPPVGEIDGDRRRQDACPGVLACMPLLTTSTRNNVATTKEDTTPTAITTTLAVTTMPTETTTLLATTSDVATIVPTTTLPAVTECTVKLFEGNGANRDEWQYSVTVKGKGSTVSKDWKDSSKNDELTSLCISQPGCTVYLYKNKKLRGASKVFVGTSAHNRGCGTFYGKSDLGAFNDRMTSFEVVAAP